MCFNKCTCVCVLRHDSDSDTESTDSNYTWGGSGKFEYSSKALPHALVHYAELLMRAGHHQSFCTAVVESVHKIFIKKAAIYSQTVASHNRSFVAMLEWVLWQTLWEAVIALIDKQEPVVCSESISSDAASSRDSTTDSVDGPLWKQLGDPLRRATTNWSETSFSRGRLKAEWSSSFIDDNVRLTRLELLTIFCSKFRIDPTPHNLRKVMSTLAWEFFGTLRTNVSSVSRKFVAHSPRFKDRHDFVRVKGTYDNTCLSVQLVAFIKISGFSDAAEHAGLKLPKEFRSPFFHNEESVVFGLVRWMSPHDDSLLRDGQLRPVCVPPLDINHAMWTFSMAQRPLLTPSTIHRNILYYDESEKHARYDLLEPECFESFINCTLVNKNKNTILETITLPFD